VVERSVDGWPGQIVSPSPLRTAIWTDELTLDETEYSVRVE
jgi:hypothetical protein